MKGTAQSFWTTWGTTPAERALSFPCDRYLPDADGVYFRAVEVRVPAFQLFRWLCQLRVAPYSYDWIDNLGHRSPRQLTAGLENLEFGQHFGIWQLVDFENDRHLTGLATSPQVQSLYGESAVSYFIVPQTDETCRLIVKLRILYPKKAWGCFLRLFLPVGDLIMMRKQLFNLKYLAESSCF
ncbi:hypothetical protein [Ktedonobacter racemifer]|uniref:Polyketide cyclase/dehydrase n=1 Tax=Ktedonobacter racemifer DSM 44963 TaxID=485913 RepID=D6TXU4_KTERA|nr:hypothetical protein [Ktedonobacter racemifer]EFH83141.1 conserved hypothetical protein [Ktedonobacter racemifer DSM 44963]